MFGQDGTLVCDLVALETTREVQRAGGNAPYFDDTPKIGPWTTILTLRSYIMGSPHTFQIAIRNVHMYAPKESLID